MITDDICCCHGDPRLESFESLESGNTDRCCTSLEPRFKNCSCFTHAQKLFTLQNKLPPPHQAKSYPCIRCKLFWKLSLFIPIARPQIEWLIVFSGGRKPTLHASNVRQLCHRACWWERQRYLNYSLLKRRSAQNNYSNHSSHLCFVILTSCFGVSKQGNEFNMELNGWKNRQRGEAIVYVGVWAAN